MEIVMKFMFLGFWAFNSVYAMDSLLSPKGVNYEVAALMSVKNKMKDETEVLSGWDINSVDPCTWNMVGCSAEGFVVSLEMASKGLSGTVSTNIGEFTHLHTLLLQNNQLTGPIPSELGQLSELKTLDLSGNRFSGKIPASLGFLTHLNYLRLSRNLLSGRIPQLVAGLSGLSFLDLSFNNLSGPTPRILAKDYRIVGNAFLCGSASLELCSDAATPVRNASGLSEKDNSKHHSLVLSFAFGIIVAFIISLMFFFFWVLWHRSRLSRSYVQQDYEFEIGHLKRFSFREIQSATSNFSPKNILGQGGFGMVYKGYLPNGTVVAVKRLKDPNYTGEVQFQTEVEMIGLAVHRNLLRLFGFCMTSEERMLVRICIALGAARGLVYLHEQCNPKIIHRDVKAANILLDESFEAIVGDFGLAKLLDQRDSHVTTAVRGTIGHIAPEYLSTGQSSEKTDVFGFGILILELVTGHKMIDQVNGQIRKGMILSWVRTLKAEKRFAEMVDRDLKGKFDDLVLEEVVELALLCTQPNPSLRPRMSEVLKVLEGLVEQYGYEQTQSGYEARGPSVSRNFSNGHEENSFIIEAIELSGPR
ncbi:hypothetical protein HID58_076232 [Brassica napus]|uniref:Protein kinase domain-containing protein n=1 Tax=Brassica napus TaxID=3708 RepID=A0ABQ7YLX3_BRANA|nr:hypothetical protein HID58_076232 [Brassica napus]